MARAHSSSKSHGVEDKQEGMHKDKWKKRKLNAWFMGHMVEARHEWQVWHKELPILGIKICKVSTPQIPASEQGSEDFARVKALPKMCCIQGLLEN